MDRSEMLRTGLAEVRRCSSGKSRSMAARMSRLSAYGTCFIFCTSVRPNRCWMSRRLFFAATEVGTSSGSGGP